MGAAGAQRPKNGGFRPGQLERTAGDFDEREERLHAGYHDLFKV
jgi:hypothetical protein